MPSTEYCYESMTYICDGHGPSWVQHPSREHHTACEHRRSTNRAEWRICFGHAAIRHARRSDYSFLPGPHDCLVKQIARETAQSSLDTSVLENCAAKTFILGAWICLTRSSWSPIAGSRPPGLPGRGLSWASTTPRGMVIAVKTTAMTPHERLDLRTRGLTS